MRPAIRLILAPLQGWKDPDRIPVHGMSHRRTILIDPRVGDPVATYVHERIHIEHPSWTEDQVLVAEKKKLRRMTWRERAYILQQFGHAKIMTRKEVQEDGF